jgi:hypothetical protein
MAKAEELAEDHREHVALILKLDANRPRTIESGHKRRECRGPSISSAPSSITELKILNEIKKFESL